MVMSRFFQSGPAELVDSPNRHNWWHSMPLPDGTRVNGANPDKDLQFKMWDALKIPCAGGLAGKAVLDIGANDGFFTLAAFKAGARKVTAINSADWSSYPANLRFASEVWGLCPEIITADFRTHPFRETFDVIFFFGVLYHLEDVHGCIKLLRNLLADQGTLYIETQMSAVQSDLPIFESASDIYPTTVSQYKKELNATGLSNYLFPNEHAILNLAFSYDFESECLSGPHNRYTQENPYRRFFKWVKRR
jgi:tRNA (mo5U34)-methyltransferase